ncbi:hypothetical protein IW146_007756 [Coemansia sp. RSA 922]|nr:hypothetical protein GGI16_009342 [Coemansia sp. S142-1]KAJ2097800.1 hypothetical protein GGI09_003639 [Coemansia sp. S100]KAJ2106493.1 hypothetical protein IW146_007756 [Coemansia sp. RSA 922]KAJ2421036.1 hypothetical protein GGF41_004023 [Coemansia sp. RSA 2531]
MSYLQVFRTKAELVNYVDASISQKCMVLMVRYPEFLKECKPEKLNKIKLTPILFANSLVAGGRDNALYIGDDARAVEDELILDEKYFVAPIECPRHYTEVIKNVEDVLKFYGPETA